MEVVVQALTPSFVLSVLQTTVSSCSESVKQDSTTNLKGFGQSELLPAFHAFIDQIYGSLGFAVAQVRARSGNPSTELPAHNLVSCLVDDIVSHIFQDASLSVIVPHVLHILRDVDGDVRDSVLYRQFVAQAVEVRMASRSLGDKRVCVSPAPSESQDWWQHRWLFNSQKFNRIKVEGHHDTLTYDCGFSMTILELLCSLNRWFCVDITLNGNHLVISSALSGHNTASHPHSGMSLVLDGRSRVFRAFPDGLATMVTLGSSDEWSWGDYCGRVAHDQRSFELLLFCFRQKTTQRTGVVRFGNHDKSPTAIEALRIDVCAAISHTSEHGVEQILNDTSASELSVFVNISHHAGESRGSSGDLREISCTCRAEHFSSLEWQLVSSFDATYEHTNVRNSH